MSRGAEANEQRYYDALKRITRYQSIEHLRKHSGKEWGLDYEEALEAAYMNIQDEAREEVERRRRPKDSETMP